MAWQSAPPTPAPPEHTENVILEAFVREAGYSASYRGRDPPNHFNERIRLRSLIQKKGVRGFLSSGRNVRSVGLGPVRL